MNSPDEQMHPEVESESADTNPLWRALTRMQRRVAGVLVEKSKTTPDIYPMTINAIKTASNQKSNRSPQMDLREDEVEETLYQLRQMGAAIEVHSGGRVPKFKHQLYEWLSVEKVELAVMAELLLRGEQTLGDLRGRAARMDRIAGVSELKPIVAGLVEKGLIVELTSPGRGQIVTHGLYEPDEMVRLKAQFSNYQPPVDERSGQPNQADTPSAAPALTPMSSPIADERVDQLIQEVSDLKKTVEALRQELADVQELLK